MAVQLIVNNLFLIVCLFINYLGRGLCGDSMPCSKAKLLCGRSHKACRGRLASHYGDGLGQHLLPAVRGRLTACMRLTQTASHHTHTLPHSHTAYETDTHCKSLYSYTSIQYHCLHETEVLIHFSLLRLPLHLADFQCISSRRGH